MKTKMPESEEEWEKKLTPDQYRILREKGTEAPFTGHLLNKKDKGNYTCAACGQVLFSSDAKFESGTGWPSFDSPANTENVQLKEDYSLGMHQYYHLIIPIHKDNTLTLFERLCGLSAIARLASKYKLKILHPPKLQPSIAYDTPDPFVDRIYVRNLQTLKILSEQIAAYTIFVPQVLNYQAFWEEKEQNGSVGWTESITNRAMPSLMDRFNSLMNPVCAKEDYKCLVLDSVLNVKWKPQDFVDDGHFSRKGGEKFADVLSQVIQSKAKELGIYDGAK